MASTTAPAPLEQRAAEQIARVRDLVDIVLRTGGIASADDATDDNADPQVGDRAVFFARGQWRNGRIAKVTARSVVVEYMTLRGVREARQYYDPAVKLAGYADAEAHRASEANRGLVYERAYIEHAVAHAVTHAPWAGRVTINSAIVKRDKLSIVR